MEEESQRENLKGILKKESWTPGLLELESGRGILEEESWRNPGGGILKEGPRVRILEEESWRRKFRKEILREEA